MITVRKLKLQDEYEKQIKPYEQPHGYVSYFNYQSRFKRVEERKKARKEEMTTLTIFKQNNSK